MSEEKILVSMNLDTYSIEALNTMKAQLGISKSALVRLLVIGGYEQFKVDRTLPAMTHKQLELVNE